MRIRLKCPHCQAKLKLEQLPLPGTLLPCPGCGNSFAFRLAAIQGSTPVENRSQPARPVRTVTDSQATLQQIPAPGSRSSGAPLPPPGAPPSHLGNAGRASPQSPDVPPAPQQTPRPGVPAVPQPVPTMPRDRAGASEPITPTLRMPLSPAPSSTAPPVKPEPRAESPRPLLPPASARPTARSDHKIELQPLEDLHDGATNLVTPAPAPSGRNQQATCENIPVLPMDWQSMDQSPTPGPQPAVEAPPPPSSSPTPLPEGVVPDSTRLYPPGALDSDWTPEGAPPLDLSRAPGNSDSPLRGKTIPPWKRENPPDLPPPRPWRMPVRTFLLILGALALVFLLLVTVYWMKGSAGNPRDISPLP